MTLASAPPELIAIIASFLVPRVAPLLRAVRWFWPRFKQDFQFLQMCVCEKRRSFGGRERIARYARELITWCPDLNRLLPLPVDVNVDRLALSPSPRGRFIAFAALDVVHIVEGVTLKRVASRKELSHPALVYHGLSFTHNGAILACGKRGAVDLYAEAGWALVKTCVFSECTWYSVVHLVDGTLVTAGYSAAESRLVTWNSTVGEPEHVLDIARVQTMRASPCQAVFAICAFFCPYVKLAEG